MREILFRGKRVCNGEWIYGSMIAMDSDIASSQVFIFPPYNGASLIPCSFLVSNNMAVVAPETIGQYTGLADKYGTKIFEGDICRNSKTGEIVSVKWHGTMAGFVWSKPKEKSRLYDFGELFRVHDKYEVIGNIHDNPELIGGVGNG